jgi:hypothetical protein
VAFDAPATETIDALHRLNILFSRSKHTRGKAVMRHDKSTKASFDSVVHCAEATGVVGPGAEDIARANSGQAGTISGVLKAITSPWVRTGAATAAVVAASLLSTTVIAQEVSQDEGQPPVTTDVSVEPDLPMVPLPPEDPQAAFAGAVEEAFGSVRELSDTPCDSLVRVLESDPTLLSRVREYVTVLKLSAANDPSLAGPSAQGSLANLDAVLRQLDATQASCGV